MVPLDPSPRRPPRSTVLWIEGADGQQGVVFGSFADVRMRAMVTVLPLECWW